MKTNDARSQIAALLGLCAFAATLFLSPLAEAQTWTKKSTWGGILGAAFQKVVTSDGGNRLYAIEQTSGTTSVLSATLNGGVTWNVIPLPGTHQFSDVATSADGFTVVATDARDSTSAILQPSTIYISTDAGATFSKAYPESSIYFSAAAMYMHVTASADGQRLATVSTNGRLYTSTDGGATWTHQTGTSVCNGKDGFLAGSRDGLSLATAPGNLSAPGYVCTSSDGGATWTLRTGSGYGYTNAAGKADWNAGAVSSNGLNLVARAGYGVLLMSNDGGATWGTNWLTSILPQGDTAAFQGQTYQGLSVSASGSNILVVDGRINATHRIYYSTDFGYTWAQQQGTGVFTLNPAAAGMYGHLGLWGACAMTASGNQMFLNDYHSSFYATLKPKPPLSKDETQLPMGISDVASTGGGGPRVQESTDRIDLP